MNPFPDHRDLYVLIAGVVLGVLLSGAVLGNLAPDVYRQIFEGISEQQIEEAQQGHVELQEKLMRLRLTDVSAVEIERVLNEARLDDDNPINIIRHSVEQRTAQFAGVLGALVLGVVLVMAIETQVTPLPRDRRQEIKPIVGRLKNIRYALIAVALTIILAHPTLIKSIPWMFLIIMLVVGLVVGLIPLKSSKPVQTDNMPDA